MICFAAGVLLAAALPAVVCAQEKFDPAARAKIVAPFVEATTVGVARVDLARIKVDPLFDQLNQSLPLAKEELAEAKPNVRKVYEALEGTGAKELYLVITLARGIRQPLVYGVVPLAPETDANKIAALLHASPVASERLGNALVFGESPEALARLGHVTPAPRPELTAAFAAAGDTAIQLLLLPPKYFRRVIDETMPELPKELGGGPSKVITDGLLWAAAGIDPPPRTAVQFVIQSHNAQAAEALRSKLVELMRAALQIKGVRHYLTKPEETIELLTPKVKGDRLLLTLDETNQGIAKAMALLTPPLEYVRVQVGAGRSVNNLKMLGLAMHNYHDVYKHFPLPGSLTPDNKPLLSWRVHLLPFLEQSQLYKQFHLNEPWDSPHNRSLIEKMPDVYRLPVSGKGKGYTHYVVPVGNGAGFEATKPTKISDIPDGTCNTLMIVEVDDDHAVIWTKPDDLRFDPKDPAKGLGRFFDGGFHATIFDGSVRLFPPTVPRDTLRALFTRAGGEPIQWNF